MKQVGIDKKQVIIDNKKGIVEVDGKQIPRLLLGIIRGGVGKCFVVKHYKGRKKKGRKIVVTRYPNMSGIVASTKQRERRDLFREAVVYAQWIISDEERKKAFRKTLPKERQNHVYQAAIRLYMSMQGDAGWLRKQLAVKEVMRGVNSERQTAVGGFGPMESWRNWPWKVVWQKIELGRGKRESMGARGDGAKNIDWLLCDRVNQRDV